MSLPDLFRQSKKFPSGVDLDRRVKPGDDNLAKLKSLKI